MNVYRKMMGIFVVLLLFLLFFSTSTEADTKIESIPGLKVGDYFRYNLTENIMSESTAKIMLENYNKKNDKNISLKNTTNISSEPVLDKVIGKETIKVEGKTYKTKLSRMDINLTFDIIPEKADFKKIEVNISVELKTWQSKNGTVKSRTEMFRENTFKNYTPRNIIYLNKYRYIKTSLYQEPKQGLDFPLKVEKTWENTVNKTTIINQTSWHKAKRYDEKWSKNGPYTYKSTWPTTMTYEVLSESEIDTEVGEFECLKIKHYTGDDVGNYTYTYLSKEGIPVKTIDHGENMGDIRMVLTDYRYQNLNNNDPKTLEGYWWALIAGVAGLLFGLSLAYSNKGKGQEEYETGSVEGYERYHPEDSEGSNGRKISKGKS